MAVAELATGVGHEFEPVGGVERVPLAPRPMVNVTMCCHVAGSDGLAATLPADDVGAVRSEIQYFMATSARVLDLLFPS
ncbi:hypothetical protein D9M69_617390 [compost metagenome]